MSEHPDTQGERDVAPPGPDAEAHEPPAAAGGAPGDQVEAPPDEAQAALVFRHEHEPDDEHHVPGTVALTFIFLLCFAVYYFANWKALADVWHVR